MSNAVEIKAITDDSVTIAGYGVVWGAHDIEGDTFTPQTNFDGALVPTKRVYYDHTLDADVQEPLGTVIETKADDTGLWVEAQLDRSRRYVDAVVNLIEKGVLGWSSGSISHLVRREGKSIKAWPIVEFSLTPTPAEPRTLGVHRLKALVADHPELEALLQAVADKATVADAGTDADAPAEIKTFSGELAMSEQTQAPVTEPVDIAAIVRGAVADAVKAMRDELAKEEPAVKGAAAVPATPKDPADKGPYKSLGMFLQDVAAMSIPGGQPRYPDYLRNFKALGLNETVPSQGGFLVQQDLVGGLVERMYETGQVMSRCWRIPVGANSNGVKLNALAETSRATGSRWGGVRGYWLAEGATKTSSMPEFRQIQLDLKKVAAVVYATDELLQDATALEGIVNRVVPDELRFLTEDAIIRGAGGVQPAGILGSGALVSVAKENLQAADTVVFENIVKMWSRMWAPSRRNAVWYINQDVEPQLYGMSMDVGTGGVPVYMPAGGLSGAMYGTLFGRPVIPIEQADTVGDQGDVILADMSQYALIEKGGIQSASSIHVAFLTDEQVFRFVYRVDGQSLWNSALTPFQGANTLSPFVVLDAR
jgi:HK97 family phage major capsid protein